MQHKIHTLLVVGKALMREALASLLASTEYKPDRTVSSLDELTAGSVDLEPGSLVIVSRDALVTRELREPRVQLIALKDRHPDCHILVLGDCLDPQDVLAALDAGASGYLMCTLTSGALVKSLDLVMLGETVVSSEFVRAVCERNRSEHKNGQAMAGTDGSMHVNGSFSPTERELSCREAAILARLRRGESNKNIARGIGIAEATVKSHVKAILRKINVKNRTQAAMWAHANLDDGDELRLQPPMSIAVAGQNGSALKRMR